MKLEEIMSLAEEDAALDYSELGIEATKLTKLIMKWLKIFSTERLTYLAFKRKADLIYKELSDYYSGRGENVYEHRLMKEDIKLYITNDDKYKDIRDKIEMQEIKIEFLENFIKALHSRGFNIKSAIEYLKFTNGNS